MNEWAEMLNRGTEDRLPLSLSWSLLILNGTIAFQKPKNGKGIKNKNSKYFSL